MYGRPPGHTFTYCFHRVATTQVTIGDKMKMWPNKGCKLLASMYTFATINYLNKVCTTSETVSWITFGVFSLHPTGCILLKMILNGSDCCVSLIHECGILKLGSVIEYVIYQIKGAPPVVFIPNFLLNCMYIWSNKLMYVYVAVPRQGSMSAASANAVLSGHCNIFVGRS